MLCPACPIPGVNIGFDDALAPSDDWFVVHFYFFICALIYSMSRYTVTASRSIDANFHQHLKKKMHDPDDCDLIQGTYFPDAEEYDAYLKRVSDSDEVSAAHNTIVKY